MKIIKLYKKKTQKFSPPCTLKNETHDESFKFYLLVNSFSLNEAS